MGKVRTLFHFILFILNLFSWFHFRYHTDNTNATRRGSRVRPSQPPLFQAHRILSSASQQSVLCSLPFYRVPTHASTCTPAISSTPYCLPSAIYHSIDLSLFTLESALSAPTPHRPCSRYSLPRWCRKRWSTTHGQATRGAPTQSSHPIPHMSRRWITRGTTQGGRESLNVRLSPIVPLAHSGVHESCLPSPSSQSWCSVQRTLSTIKFSTL